MDISFKKQLFHLLEIITLRGSVYSIIHYCISLFKIIEFISVLRVILFPLHNKDVVILINIICWILLQ